MVHILLPNDLTEKELVRGLEDMSVVWPLEGEEVS